MIKFKYTSVQLIDTDLDDVERRFGFKFPKSFRTHYLKFNGGHPEKDRFVDEKGTSILHDFFPIKISAVPTLDTLERCLLWLKVDRSILPRHLVPFANDAFDNMYCFSTREEDLGTIYWFRTKANPKQKAEYLASSLEDFLTKLKTKEEVQAMKQDGAI